MQANRRMPLPYYQDFSKQQHGEFIDKNGTLFMGTYHPAAILRNPNNKEAAFGDWLALIDKINELGIEI